MKHGSFLPVFGFVFALVAVASAVPTPERIRELYPERTDLIEEISSFGRLVAHDAHRVYRKSFDGIQVNDLDAMLDQLLDSRTRLWSQLSTFLDNDSEDETEDDDTEDLFTELISQLQIDPDSMSALLSGEDRLTIDGKRMECMMELLDKLVERIKNALEELEEDQGSWVRRWVVRQLKSAMEALLRVVDSIKSAIEDAEIEILDEEIDESIDEEESEASEEEDGILVLDNGEGEEEKLSTDDDDAIDEEWAKVAEEDQDELGDKSKRSVALRRKRDTVTSNFGSRQTGYRHLGLKGLKRFRDASLEDSFNKPLVGGWSIGSRGLKWTNLRQKRHTGQFYYHY